jgi:hypothetical protein
VLTAVCRLLASSNMTYVHLLQPSTSCVQHRHHSVNPKDAHNSTAAWCLSTTHQLAE